MLRLRICLAAAGMAIAIQAPGETLPAQRRTARPTFQAKTPEATPPDKVKERSGKSRKTGGELPTALVRGVVRNPSGQNAALATVWLVTRREEAFDPARKTKTDASGRFAFAELDEENLFGRGITTTVIARDADGRIGWFDVPRYESSRYCDVRLRDVATIEGRVLDEQSQPLAGARLTPKSFTAPRQPNASNDYVVLFPDLAAELAVSTAIDGGFTIAGMPRAVTVACQLTAPDIEKIEVSLEPGIAATVRLGKPGGIAGSVASPKGAKLAIEGLQLQVLLLPDTDRPQDLAVRVSETTTVDREGGFRFDGLPPGKYVIRPVDHQDVPFFGEPTPPIELKAGQQITDVAIPLIKARQVRGRVVDAETGAGVEAVEVAVLSRSPDERRGTSLSIATDADGRFSVWLKPGQVGLLLRRVPDQFLQPPFESVSYRSLPDGEWPTIELERGAQIEGVVVDEAGKAIPFAEVSVGIRHLRPYDFPHQTDRWGKFMLHQLPPTEPIAVRARTATAVTKTAVQITPSEAIGPLELVVSEAAACWVVGQAVDPRGLPVPAAQVSVSGTRRSTVNVPRFSTVDNPLTVAADGTFQSEALWPGDDYRLRIIAEGFSRRDLAAIRGEAGKLYDFGPLTLDPAVTVIGQVVDEAGQPVPHAQLHVILPPSSAANRLVRLESDTRGDFSVPNVDPSDTLTVWARSTDAASSGAEVILASQFDRPMKIVVSDKFAFRLTGKVADARGQPIPGAKVSAVWEHRRGDRPISFGLRRGPRSTILRSLPLGDSICDADGAFKTEALWPGENYHLIVAAAGYDTLHAPVALGAAGETRDLRLLAMARSDLSVEGRVVDAAGKPVEGATVYNSGDAPQPLSVKTDAEGRFRLEGLFEGPVYALVQKAECQPAGLRCAAGDREQTVTLLKVVDAPDASRPPRALEKLPSPEERRAAIRRLAELWTLRDRTNQKTWQGIYNPATTIRLVQAMARLDLRRALSWSASEGGAFDDEALIAAAEQMVADDLAGALSLLADLHTTQCGYALRAMAARRIAAGARDDAARLLEAAIEPERLSDQPIGSDDSYSVSGKAAIGRMAVAAGRIEWGRQVIDEAAKAAEKLGPRQTDQMRLTVAAALAAIDPPRALKLLGAVHEHRFVGSSLYNDAARIAVAMATTDLPEAQKLLSMFRQPEVNTRRSNVDGRLRMEMAYRLAPTNLPEALRLIDEIASDDPEHKAAALGWAAVAIAGRDKPGANSLIDRALEVFLDVRPRTRPTTPLTSWAVGAARIAQQAAEIGYPDMHSVVGRALALRLTSEDTASPAERAQSTIQAARLLALADPAVARELLAEIDGPVDLVGVDGASAGAGEWLQAWALADLARAEKHFDDALAIERGQRHPDLIESGLLPMVELLACPPAARARLLLNQPSLLYLWFPGDD